MAQQYQVLARKYRPKNFHQLIGQDHVAKALINAIDYGRLHHAYLFTGTRGVGKTTIARILSKCLNCDTGVTSTPCGVCENCVAIDQGRFIDLIEIDAASRTKVEDTRELLDNVPYAPTQGRYKVYLIDEVHMLSTHSFNALLKTLEEPPEHVKFLLATTDPQKLPITIISRCLQFVLRPLAQSLLAEHLGNILDQENVAYTAPALWQLANAAKGSVRDALSLTDQAIAFGQGTLTDETVNSMLGLINSADLLHLLADIYDNDRSAVAAQIQQMRLQMVDAASMFDGLAELLHQMALLQLLPEVTLGIDEGQAQSIKQLAQRISPEVLQLYYEIVIQARESIKLANTPMQALEMCLLRLLAFRPLAPDEIVQPPVSPTPSPTPDSAASPEAVTTAEVGALIEAHKSSAAALSDADDVSNHADTEFAFNDANSPMDSRTDAADELTASKHGLEASDAMTYEADAQHAASMDTLTTTNYSHTADNLYTANPPQTAEADAVAGLEKEDGTLRKDAEINGTVGAALTSSNQQTDPSATEYSPDSTETQTTEAQISVLADTRDEDAIAAKSSLAPEALVADASTATEQQLAIQRQQHAPQQHKQGEPVDQLEPLVAPLTEAVVAQTADQLPDSAAETQHNTDNAVNSQVVHPDLDEQQQSPEFAAPLAAESTLQINQDDLSSDVSSTDSGLTTTGLTDTDQDNTTFADDPRHLLRCPEQSLTGEWSVEKWDYWLQNARETQQLAKDELALARQGVMSGQCDGPATFLTAFDARHIQSTFQQLVKSLQQQFPNTSVSLAVDPDITHEEKGWTPELRQKQRMTQATAVATQKLQQSPVMKYLASRGQGRMGKVKIIDG